MVVPGIQKVVTNFRFCFLKPFPQLGETRYVDLLAAIRTHIFKLQYQGLWLGEYADIEHIHRPNPNNLPISSYK